MRTAMLFASLSISVAALALMPGCSEAEKIIDCQQICQNKQDCVNNDYNVSACRQDCERRTDTDESFRDAAHVCEACLDNKACAEQKACFLDCPVLK
jgi:hypothetical protein